MNDVSQKKKIPTSTTTRKQLVVFFSFRGEHIMIYSTVFLVLFLLLLCCTLELMLQILYTSPVPSRMRNTIMSTHVWPN
jgi:hypothetical protein